MKLCKKYEEYREAQDQGLVWVDCKKLEKILKMCRIDQMDSHDHQLRLDGSHSDEDYSRNHRNCAVCDGAFFPSLHEEMSAVVGCFNKRAQKLLQQHLSSGIRKYFTWVKGKNQGNRIALVREGKDLVTYALINVIAFRKILKKYDKIHFSEKGQAFKSQAQNMQIEILQSPWLRELIAFHVNSGRAEINSDAPPALFEGFSLTFNDDKPSLTCELFDSIKLDIELTCSICLVSSWWNPSSQEPYRQKHSHLVLRNLKCFQNRYFVVQTRKNGDTNFLLLCVQDTIFDPVSLGCGHMFCYMCACSAASVSIVDGLKAAEPKHQCPLCRQRRVYADVVLLKELNILVSQSCPDYWEKRRQSERIERVRQAKEHWESISRAFMGV